MDEADLIEISGNWAILASDGEQSTLSNIFNLSFTTNFLSLKEEILPEEFSLASIYPNPFNPKTTISYDVSTLSNVNINIYNMNGQLVEVLSNKLHQPGSYNVIWNAAKYTSGVYFVKLIAGDFVDTQKIMLIK